jgi:hypothetical protein
MAGEVARSARLLAALFFWVEAGLAPAQAPTPLVEAGGSPK